MIRLRELRASAVPPRVHGNGFIQLDLRPGARLHVWGHSEIPAQKIQSTIHDHTFDFYSLCLVGAICNRVCAFKPADPAIGHTMRVWTPVARHGEDTRLVSTDTIGRACVQDTEWVQPQGWYAMERGVLHETKVFGPTATLMFKTGIQFPGESPARVLLPDGVEPDNEFDRNTAGDFDLLWTIIADVLGPECDL